MKFEICQFLNSVSDVAFVKNLCIENCTWASGSSECTLDIESCAESLIFNWCVNAVSLYEFLHYFLADSYLDILHA